MSTISQYNSLDEDRYLFISSANRSSGTNSRFTIYLPNNLISSASNKQKYLKVQLYNATLVYEWYNVQTINNKISYNNGTTTSVVEIPVGNYSVYTLATTLTALLPVYTVTYNPSTNKYTYTSSVPTATITPVNSGQFLGLENGTTNTGTFSSTKPVNMSIYNGLYLNTDLSSTDNNLDNINMEKVDTSTILDSIPINCAPFDTLYYENTHPTSLDIAVSNNSLTSISFYITTDTGARLELTHPWTITLQLQIFSNED